MVYTQVQVRKNDYNGRIRHCSLVDSFYLRLRSMVEMIDEGKVTIANILLSLISLPGTLLALVVWLFDRPFMHKILKGKKNEQ